MSDVVLRCPHCGTVQAVAGECEACHESQVRYFCPNHAPGRWLVGPICPDCGARVVSERTKREREMREREARDADERAERDRVEREQQERIRVMREREARERAAPPPLRERPAPTADPLPGPTRGPMRGPAREPLRAPGAPGPRTPVAAPSIGLAVGCVGRIFLLLMVVLVLLALGTCWLVGGSGGLGDWVVDAGQQVGLVEGVPEPTRRGIAAYQAGDLPRARRELEEAARGYPRSGVAPLYLARLALDADDEARALTYLQEAVRREPDLAVAHRELAGLRFVRARRQRAAGDPELGWRAELVAAEQHYARALALDPTDRRARGYYGCVLADLGVGAPAQRELALAGDGPWVGCGAAPPR